MSVLSVISINPAALFFDIKRINDVIDSVHHSSLPCEDRLALFTAEFNKRSLSVFTIEVKNDLGCADVFINNLKLPLCTVDAK